MNERSSFRSRVEAWFKRAFDFTAALIGLICLLPFFGLIAILIKRDTPGPVFHWASRIGRYGRLFHMLKFRTMYETPESYRGLRVTCEDDERVTPFGGWLRDTKLNELPQLWNVLIGEMSLVGPRPEDPQISRTWPARIAAEILTVRPGITSPASILYRNEESMLHAGEVMQKYLRELSPDKMRLDQLYVRYQSFWLDLDVILWTAILLAPRIKAYSPPEQLLFVGPVTRFVQRVVHWIAVDFLVAFVSMMIVGGFVRLFAPLDLGWKLAAGMAIGASVLYSLAGSLFNTHHINWQKAPLWEAGRIGASWMVSTAVILSLHVYLHLTGPRVLGILIGASILTLSGMVAVRYRWRLASGLLSRAAARRLHKDEVRERVLIVGSGRTAEHIAWLMAHPTYAGKFQIVGFIDNDLMSQGMNIYGSKVIGKVEDIQRIVKKRGINLIVLADNRIALHRYSGFHNTANFLPARVVVAPDLFGSLSSLDGGAAGSQFVDAFNDFQCQHCLARCASRPIPFKEIVSFQHIPSD